MFFVMENREIFFERTNWRFQLVQYSLFSTYRRDEFKPFCFAGGNFRHVVILYCISDFASDVFVFLSAEFLQVLRKREL